MYEEVAGSRASSLAAAFLPLHLHLSHVLNRPKLHAVEVGRPTAQRCCGRLSTALLVSRSMLAQRACHELAVSA